MFLMSNLRTSFQIWFQKNNLVREMVIFSKEAGETPSEQGTY